MHCDITENVQIFTVIDSEIGLCYKTFRWKCILEFRRGGADISISPARADVGIGIARGLISIARGLISVSPEGWYRYLPRADIGISLWVISVPPEGWYRYLPRADISIVRGMMFASPGWWTSFQDFSTVIYNQYAIIMILALLEPTLGQQTIYTNETNETNEVNIRRQRYEWDYETNEVNIRRRRYEWDYW